MFASFFFMSVGFPTIFALGIRGLGEHTKLASSLIVMSIVGGAIAPPFMGHIADHHSMRTGIRRSARLFRFRRSLWGDVGQSEQERYLVRHGIALTGVAAVRSRR